MTVTEQTFDDAAGDLFDVIVNPQTYPRWLVGAKNIREVSVDWPQPGSFFKHTVGFGPIAIPDKTTVRNVEAPRMLELLVRAAGDRGDRPIRDHRQRIGVQADDDRNAGRDPLVDIPA